MEQNTNRMWWTIGLIVLGGLLISGFAVIADTNVMPRISEKANALLKKTEPDVTHTAYAESPDGKTGFTTDVVWNLLSNSRLQTGQLSPWTIVSDAKVSIDAEHKGLNISHNSVGFGGVSQTSIPTGSTTSNQDFTLSLTVINTGTVSIDNLSLEMTFKNKSASDIASLNQDYSIPADGKPHKIVLTRPAPADSETMYASIYDIIAAPNSSHSFVIYDMKLEKNSTATSWTPSESDIKNKNISVYYGTYTDKSETASQDPAKYTWKLAE